MDINIGLQIANFVFFRIKLPTSYVSNVINTPKNTD